MTVYYLKLNKLCSSFSLCNHIMYGRICRQSMRDLNFRPHFWKNHEGYSSQFHPFWHTSHKWTIFCQNVRLYDMWLCTKNEHHSMFSFVENFINSIIIEWVWHYIIHNCINFHNTFISMGTFSLVSNPYSYGQLVPLYALFDSFSPTACDYASVWWLAYRSQSITDIAIIMKH